MKKNLNKKMTVAVAVALVLSIMLVGCGAAAASSSKESTETKSTSAVTETENRVTDGKADTSSVDETATEEVKTSDNIQEDNIFTKRDINQEADLTDAVSIEAEDGKTYGITEEGVYVLSGKAENFTVKVDADSTEKVQIVLEGAEISNEDFPVIYVVSADKVFITTAEGSENTLQVTSGFVSDGDTNTDAVIFSKDDLTLNGLGTLNIVCYDGNGVSCKDDLKITGGTYTVQTAKDSFEANDSILIAAGSFDVVSYKDAFHCENGEDSSVGNIYIENGTFNIQSRSDGIQAATTLVIEDGTFNISSKEGLEATYVEINGGNITVSASDDGINASNKSSSVESSIVINGGKISITMGAGDTDALDSNGSLIINGGEISIEANFPFDYTTNGAINGGTVYVNGQQVTEIRNSMMGGGMFGNMHGGFGGPGGGMPGGELPGGEMPPDGGFGGGGFGGGHGRPGGGKP